MSGKRIAGEKLKPRTDLEPADLERLAVDSFGADCWTMLRKTGWQDLAAAFVGLSLAADNKRVLLTNFFLVGRLHKDESTFTAVKANKYWPKVPASVELRLRLDNLHVFRFDGKLQSSLVPSETLTFELFDVEKKQQLKFAEFKELGGSDFTMRIFAQMTTVIWCKLTFAILPYNKEALLDNFPYAKNPLFPWMRIDSAEVSILPNADKLYGLPFVPFLLKGTKDEQFPAFSSFDFRQKIASLLQSGLAPRMVPDALKLEAKLRKLESSDNPEGALVPGGTPALVWPDALAPIGGENENADSEGELSDDGSEKRAGGEDEEVLSVASLSKEDLSARVRREATRAMGSFRQTRGEKQKPVARRHQSPSSPTRGHEKRQKVDSGVWEAMLVLWPLAKRPPCSLYLDKEWVDSQTVADMLQMMAAYEKLQKEVNTDGSAHRDTRPATILFERQEDDCFGSLHKARFELRMPLSDWDDWWPLMPLERTERFKSLDLKSLGADAQISKSAINRMHDRSQPKVLKWFNKKNINVTRAPMKETRLREADTIYSTTDFNWADLTSMRHCVDALINFGMISQMLWPYDMSFLVFMKLYNTFGWFSHTGVSEKRKVGLICDHFERVMSTNADRAVTEGPPCTYDEQEKILKRLLAEEGLSQYPPLFDGGVEELGAAAGRSQEGEAAGGPGRQQRAQAAANNGGAGGGGQNAGGPRGARNGGSNNRPPAVTPGGKLVCFGFNKPRGCANQPVGNGRGCKNAQTGKEFVHLCQYFYPETRMYCLQPHTRFNHV